MLLRSVLALLAFSALLMAQENSFNRALLLNHPSSLTLQKNEVELTLEYGVVNNTIDVFNIKSQEVSKERTESSFGDYDHFKVYFNVGLTDNDMLMANFIARKINFGSSSIYARHYELGYRHSFSPNLSLDISANLNEADDIRLTSVEDLNSTVHKMDPRLSIDEITPLYIWFFKTGDDSLKIGVPYEGTPFASLTDMHDMTASARLTYGLNSTNFQPNLFLGTGYTYASAIATTNLFDKASTDIQSKLPELPIDLSHKELFVTAGINTFVHLPWNFGAYAEYNYQYFFRGEEFTNANYNQTLVLELNYTLKKHLVAAVSGILFTQQLNGVIPFLYNEQTQNSFNHKYGWAAFSLSYLW